MNYAILFKESKEFKDLDIIKNFKIFNIDDTLSEDILHDNNTIININTNKDYNIRKLNNFIFEEINKETLSIFTKINDNIILYKDEKYKIIGKYNTHNNGGSNYTIYDTTLQGTDSILAKSLSDTGANKKIAFIFTSENIEKKSKDFNVNTSTFANNTPYMEIKYEEIYIGYDNINEGYYDKEYKKDLKDGIGNTILFKMKDKSYMFVYDMISVFNLSDEIVEFRSPIGNNDVPYPYIIGTEYTYALVDGNKIQYYKNSDLNGNKQPNDPYAFVFYKHKYDKVYSKIKIYELKNIKIL